MTKAETFKNLFTEDIFNALLESEINEDKAAELSLAIYQRIQLSWGGCDVYIPSGSLEEKQSRNERIKAAFNGRNHAELALAFGLHVRSIARIVNDKI